MRDYYHLHSIPCAIAPQTLGLPDVVTALSQAYPKTDLGSLGRRAIGVRLRIIADRVPGVLLLDHTRELTTAMIGFLRRLLQSSCSVRALHAIEPALTRQIVQAARGRVGWLRECVHHLEIPEYWRDGGLHVAALCTDSEIAIREGRRGPRMRPRRGSPRTDR